MQVRGLGRLAATALFLAMWFGVILKVSPLAELPGLIIVVLCIAYGYVARGWWAPAVIIVAMPAYALPQAYGDSEPNYSNAPFALVILVPVVAMLVSVGVLLARLTRPRHARSTSRLS